MTASERDTRDDRADTVARLKSELEAERAGSAELRGQLEALQSKIASLEARGPQPAESSDRRMERIEAQLREQNERLAKLGEGRERSLLEIHRLEQELKLVAGERDSLRDQLTRVEGMQSETIAFDDDDESAATGSQPAAETGTRAPAGERRATSRDDAGLPSIADLMAAGDASGLPDQEDETSAEAVASGETGWHELLPADLIVARAPGEPRKKAFSDTVRWHLVRTDVKPPKEFPIAEPLMTIGRSESADIQIDGDFVSRIHARVLLIDATIVLEDADSKNGVTVNGEPVDRWPLGHGDTVQIGTVSFRFVDAEKGD